MNLQSRLFTLVLCLFYAPIDKRLVMAFHANNRSSSYSSNSTTSPSDSLPSISLDSFTFNANLTSNSTDLVPYSLESYSDEFKTLKRSKRTIGAPEKWATLLDLFSPKPCSGRNTRFYLYTRRNRKKAQELCTGDSALLRNSHFDPRRETIILSSGWLDNRFFAKWVREGLKALLNRGDYNVIYVAWRSIKELFVAAFLIRIYSEDLAKFVNFVKYSTGITTESIHCIGHSLGAFLCSFAGDKARMRRVTVLDAGPRPYYEKMHWSKRINRNQGEHFVDVIHSDFNPNGFSLGLTIPLGDIDFYPNAGTVQTGCWRDKWYQTAKALKEDNLLVAIDQFARYALFCSHYRAHEWFFESIENRQCQFVGVLCPSYAMFLAGECACDSFTKHPYTCAPMGFDADKIIPYGSPKKLLKYFPQGKWFLKTSDFLPQTNRHCQFQYQILIKLGEQQPTYQNGTFQISFVVKSSPRMPPRVISHELVSGSPNVGIRANFRANKLMIRPTGLPLRHITGIYIAFRPTNIAHHLTGGGYGHTNFVSVHWVKLAPILINTPPLFFCDNLLQTGRIKAGTYFMERCKKPGSQNRYKKMKYA